MFSNVNFSISKLIKALLELCADLTTGSEIGKGQADLPMAVNCSQYHCGEREEKKITGESCRLYCLKWLPN